MAYYNLGNALHDAGELDEAIAHFARATELDETYVDAHFNLGIAYQEKLDYRAALRCYDTCAALDPTFQEAVEAANIIRMHNLQNEGNGKGS
ncbi:unnamed protein product [Heterosigma akashiwo]